MNNFINRQESGVVSERWWPLSQRVRFDEANSLARVPHVPEADPWPVRN